jgi:hypothetical protein
MREKSDRKDARQTLSLKPAKESVLSFPNPDLLFIPRNGRIDQEGTEIYGEEACNRRA